MQICVLSTHSHHANIEDKVLQKIQEEKKSGDNRTDGKYCMLICNLHMQPCLFASMFSFIQIAIIYIISFLFYKTELFLMGYLNFLLCKLQMWLENVDKFS